MLQKENGMRVTYIYINIEKNLPRAHCKGHVTHILWALFLSSSPLLLFSYFHSCVVPRHVVLTVD